MLDLECLEDDSMSEKNDILSTVNKAMNTLSAVSKVTGDISSIGNSYNRRQQSKESGELERIKQQIAIYDKKMARLIRCGLILWIALIVVTVILCITGNDIVLRFLHI